MSASTAIFDESKQRLQSQFSSRHSMAHALAHRSVSPTNESMSPESCVSLGSRSAYAWIWIARSNLRPRRDAQSNRCKTSCSRIASRITFQAVRVTQSSCGFSVKNAPELIVLVRTIAEWLFMRSPHRISRTSALSAAIFSPTFSGNLGVAVAPGGDDRGHQFALPPIVNRGVAHLFGIPNRRPNYTSSFSLYPIQH
jgi:hypothetical protein